MKIFLDVPEPVPSDPCHPSPCGPNSVCNNGICSCVVGYHGDPYLGCRPECVYNTDCPLDKGCSRNKCVNPCVGTCGLNAICDVMNHVPMCSCPKGMSGNAFMECRPSAGKNIFLLCWIIIYVYTYIRINSCTCVLQYLLPTHAILHHVDRTVDVNNQMVKQCVPVYLDIAVVHRHVDLNA